MSFWLTEFIRKLSGFLWTHCRLPRPYFRLDRRCHTREKKMGHLRKREEGIRKWRDIKRDKKRKACHRAL